MDSEPVAETARQLAEDLMDAGYALDIDTAIAILEAMLTSDVEPYRHVEELSD